MICGVCGTDNSAGAKFCMECAAPLAASCPNCGTVNLPTAKFCSECGTPVAAGAGAGQTVRTVSTPTTAAPRTGAAATDSGAERRLVSILFADLVGFTPFAEERDAEDVRETLTRYFDLAREVIERYGGTVEKFIGDAVMAVWGAPVTHEDDAERAVRAGLELVEAVKGIGPTIQARAGVLTGEAAVTLGATNQGMVAGDLVNTASRLQSVAPAGSVLVGERTRDASMAAIAFEEMGEKQLKGKEVPVRAWRALRVVAMRGGVGRYTGLEPPFEGRDEELRLIKELFHATQRERRARLVTVIGQAGTGKSRLIREFEKYIDGITGKIYWHVGRSPSYGEGITFWALGEMVRKRSLLAESDDEKTTRLGIGRALEEYVPSETDRRFIEPRLLQLLGVGEARAGEREETFAAWRLFFERVADKGPTIMVFEDLEFADPGLLDFIDYVVEWSRNHPILILALCRPELLEKRPGWGAGHRNYVAIGLEPLSDDAMRHALAGLVPGLPETAVRAILSRAEGVPLYAVETVRMLLNEGRIADHDGVYEPVGDLTELAIPNTLHALIAARLDTLEKDERSLLQDAAVLGQSFTVAALGGVNGRRPDELEPRLQSLVRREVVQYNADPLSPERGQYGFVQGLLREVAYSTLSKRDRRTRHLAAARYFESLGNDELAGALAVHYLDAWKAAPEGPEGDAVAAQARVALRAAAERAVSLHSPAQALSYLEHLLTVTTNEEERGAVLARAAEAADATARFDVAETYSREAMEIYRSIGDSSGLAHSAVVLWHALFGMGRTVDGEEIISRALEEVGDRPNDPAWVDMLGTLARAKAFANMNVEAIEVADRTLVAAAKLDLVEAITGAIMTKAVALSYLGRQREAMLLLPGALLFTEAHGMVAEEMRARINLSQLAMIDEPGTALTIARDGIEKAQRFGQRNREYMLAGNAMMAALRTGDWDWALGAAPEVLRDEPLTTRTCEIEAFPAIISGLRGDGGERLARDLEILEPEIAAAQDPQYVSSLEVLRNWRSLIAGELEATASVDPLQYEEPTYASASYSLAGHAALWTRNLDQAEHTRDNLNRLGVHGRLVDASRRSLEAGIDALSGNSADAVAGFAEATRMLRDHSMPLDLALCLMDEVATLGIEEPAARDAADEARRVLEDLGAVALVVHLNNLTSPGQGFAPPTASAAAVPRAAVNIGIGE